MLKELLRTTSLQQHGVLLLLVLLLPCWSRRAVHQISCDRLWQQIGSGAGRRSGYRYQLPARLLQRLCIGYSTGYTLMPPLLLLLPPPPLLLLLLLLLL
jgi:hypothetical protein